MAEKPLSESAFMSDAGREAGRRSRARQIEKDVVVQCHEWRTAAMTRPEAERLIRIVRCTHVHEILEATDEDRGRKVGRSLLQMPEDWD